MRHMTGSVYAVFDKPVHMYRGTTMAGIVRDEARHDRLLRDVEVLPLVDVAEAWERQSLSPGHKLALRPAGG